MGAKGTDATLKINVRTVVHRRPQDENTTSVNREKAVPLITWGGAHLTKYHRGARKTFRHYPEKIFWEAVQDESKPRKRHRRPIDKSPARHPNIYRHIIGTCYEEATSHQKKEKKSKYISSGCTVVENVLLWNSKKIFRSQIYILRHA